MLGTCWKCAEFSNLAKECNNNPMTINQSSSVQNQSAINSLQDAQSGLQIPQATGKIRYPTNILPTRPPF